MIGIERIRDRPDVDVQQRVGGVAERVADPFDLLRRRQPADDIVVARVVLGLGEGGRGRGERRQGDDKLTQLRPPQNHWRTGENARGCDSVAVYGRARLSLV